MGPPLKAAENSILVPKARPRLRSFNGAAAKSSGKLGMAPVVVVVVAVASMGPPLKAAENRARRRNDGHARACFNGAAAKSSGKCRRARGWCAQLSSFNGAAAKSSGKWKRCSTPRRNRHASMGPPLKAAENRREHDDRAHEHHALQWGRR